MWYTSLRQNGKMAFLNDVIKCVIISCDPFMTLIKYYWFFNFSHGRLCVIIATQWNSYRSLHHVAAVLHCHPVLIEYTHSVNTWCWAAACSLLMRHLEITGINTSGCLYASATCHISSRFLVLIFWFLSLYNLINWNIGNISQRLFLIKLY